MLDTLISAVLDFSSSNEQFHPFHVVVSASELLKYAKSYKFSLDKEFCAAIFVDDALPTHRKRNIFVIVHLHHFDKNSTNSEEIQLYVTTEFLEHYNLSYGSIVFFKPIHCFPLSKVVFYAKTAESYNLAKAKNWQMQLLLSTCRNKILCRHNDVLLVSPQIFGLKNFKLLFDIMIAVCEPIEQGLLTMETTIFVVNVSDSLSSHRFELKLFQNKNIFSPFFVPLPEKSTQSCLMSAEKKYLKLVVMQQHACVVNKILMEMNQFIDPLNVVIVPTQTFELMNLCSGETATFYINTVPIFADDLDNTKSTLQRKSRLATFVSHPSVNAVSHIAYMSPYLWFNLTGQSLMESKTTYIEVCFNEKVHLLPPYAKEVYISLVQSPHYDCTIVCDSILKSYFSKRRYLLKGDVFGIDTKAINMGKCTFNILWMKRDDYKDWLSPCGDKYKAYCTCCSKEIEFGKMGESALKIHMKDTIHFRQKSNDLDNINCPMVYFRVSVLEGSFSKCGYFIDVDHTKLYQAGTIQSYIPVLIENAPSVFSDITYFDSPNPSGMNVYVDQLISLIYPVLKIWNKGSFQNVCVSMNILLTGGHGCGKSVIVKSVCQCLNLHLYEVNCHELIGESSATTEVRLKMVIQKASVYAPCVMLFKNIEFIGKEKELKGENSRVLNSLNEELKNVNLLRSEWPIIVIATTNDISLLSGDLASSFLHHIHMDAPMEHERKVMLQHLLYPCALHPNVAISYMSQRTAMAHFVLRRLKNHLFGFREKAASTIIHDIMDILQGFILGDLAALAEETIRFRYSRLKETFMLQDNNFLEEDLTLSGIHVTQQDLISALEKEQTSKSEKSGAPKIPSVHWEDVGGLIDAKQEILDTIQLPLKHPELLLTGLRRSGILLYGPPGTGKTLLAKAVATECSLNFLSVKGPELINMYVGQSEENVRAIFHQARNASPCIIFFDELDSLAPKRGKSGDSGGVTDRVVSQFLAELDGINNLAEVFVIGATNRPDLIDSALLRPGRFDRHVYVGISDDKESRISIMSALTRKFPISTDVNLEKIIEKCPKNLTGADFYSLCSNAMMQSVKRNVNLIKNGIIQMKNAERMVKSEDFIVALETLGPSLSEIEVKQYYCI